MRYLVSFLCLMMVVMTACQSEHKRQVGMLHELLEACERYDTMPNDSDARAVLYYMERHGSPSELQQAWRMMAKMYKRHGSLFGEDFAYQMAEECVNPVHSEYDTLAMAEILTEWCETNFYSLHYSARQMADSAQTLAKAAGDSTAYYRYMALPAYLLMDVFYRQQPHTHTESEQFDSIIAIAETASRKLWQMDRKDLSVDAFFPVIAYYNDGTMPDSITKWLARYARYTRKDIRHPESRAAVEYFLQKGDYFKNQELFDSAAYYYQQIIDQSKNYAKSIAYARMIDLYKKFNQRDSAIVFQYRYNNKYVQNYFSVKKDEFLENEEEWRQRNEFITHEVELQRRSMVLVCVVVVLLLVCGFIVYRYYMLRLRHRETLEQNREYTEMLRSLSAKVENSILETPIVHHFHDLSSQDAHPKTEDWQALREEIDRLHPLLFPTLEQQYAAHQSDQAMTEQECRVVSLIAIRCSPLQMSVLLVCTKSNVSNLRRRLYIKLTGRDGSGSDLDKYVAQICEGA